jgi:hypothetical protein
MSDDIKNRTPTQADDNSQSETREGKRTLPRNIDTAWYLQVVKRLSKVLIDGSGAALEQYGLEMVPLSKEGKELIKRRREAAKRIDPEIAKVQWRFASVFDPYFGERYQRQLWVRRYFARSPGGPWVPWDDLTDETTLSLYEKYKETESDLQQSTSCWVAFCHSKYFRADAPDDGLNANENHIRYIAQAAFGCLKKEGDNISWLADMVDDLREIFAKPQAEAAPKMLPELFWRQRGNPPETIH